MLMTYPVIRTLPSVRDDVSFVQSLCTLREQKYFLSGDILRFVFVLNYLAQKSEKNKESKEKREYHLGINVNVKKHF